MEQGGSSHQPQELAMHDMLQSILGEVCGTRMAMERLKGRMDTIESRMTSVDEKMQSLEIELSSRRPYRLDH